jgi:hypothetical protein
MAAAGRLRAMAGGRGDLYVSSVRGCIAATPSASMFRVVWSMVPELLAVHRESVRWPDGPMAMGGLLAGTNSSQPSRWQP